MYGHVDALFWELSAAEEQSTQNTRNLPTGAHGRGLPRIGSYWKANIRSCYGLENTFRTSIHGDSVNERGAKLLMPTVSGPVSRTCIFSSLWARSAWNRHVEAIRVNQAALE